ncbi:MAG: DUF2141 domain-containing protein [Dysgonomonas sp.]
MKKVLLATAIATMTIVFGTSLNAQNKLTVKVSNLENSKGTLMVALFDSKTPFLGKATHGEMTKITGTEAEVTFENLPGGEYGVALFQDANNSNTLDLGQYGIPTEKYGFSNNIDPAATKGTPTFEQCKFELKGNSTIEIKAIAASK